jgi:uncharacterized protein
MAADKRVSNHYLVSYSYYVENRDINMAGDTKNKGENAADLAAMIARAAEQTAGGKAGLPPVEQWNPPFCGDIDMEIKADGTWFYMGTPIGRAPLVRLFSTVLRKDEDGKTFLVTPVEKVGIRVVDAHFIAVEMTVDENHGQPLLTFRTNVGDVMEAGADHPLRFVIEGEHQQLKPYLLVRGRLEALVSRAVTYDLLAQGEVIEIEGEPMFVIRSNGAVFPVMSADALEQFTP